MMTFAIAIQVLLTVVVTAACTYLLYTNVEVNEKYVRMNLWYTWLIRFLLVFHAVALPASLINLIWS